MPHPSQSHNALDTLVSLIHEAFEGDPAQSLLASLRDLRDEDWTPLPTSGERSRPREELIAWLTEGHRRWLASVRALPNDAELERQRLTNWGERLPTRTIIHIMIGHDYFHAGEI